jgi:antirestriction protein ArdC
VPRLSAGRRQARFTFPVADAGCNDFSKEIPMKKEEAKKLADQALSELEQALKAGQSEALVRYLDTMSRFHSYSFCNCMLIALQQPDATFVAGFRRWLQLGRHVCKGEKGIGIIAPLVYRNREDRQQSDAEERTIRGFKVVHVFDISQTEGENLPEFARIQGEPGALLQSLESLIRANGIELKDEQLPLGTKGVSRKGEIAIAEGLSPAERFAVLVHEISHEWMHDIEQRKQIDKTVRETEAEAVSYVVCRAFGLDCSTRSSDYIQMYRGSAATLAESLDRIQRTATRIIESLSKSVTDEQEGGHHVA